MSGLKSTLTTAGLRANTLQRLQADTKLDYDDIYAYFYFLRNGGCVTGAARWWKPAGCGAQRARSCSTRP